MRKTVIRSQALICIILSFVGLVNHGVWIWMTGKTRQKKLRAAGIFSFILCICSTFVAGLLGNDGIIFSVMIGISGITVFVPIVVNCLNIKTFMSCQSLWSLVKKNQINVNQLQEESYANVQIHADKLTLENSKRLFGDKSEVVLRAIQFKEWENQEMQERKRREDEKTQEEARRLKEEAKRIEMEKTRAETEAKKAETEAKKAEAKRLREENKRLEAEKSKIETEKARAEAERVRAETEAKKAEVERLREENKRLEAEKNKIEAEKVRAEAKRLEAEKIKAETERMYAEAELKRLEIERVKEEKDKLEKEKIQKEIKAERKSESYLKTTHIEPNQKVDINLCTEQELSLVQGVGIILAKKAIRIRSEKGRFESVDEFIKIVGIRENNESVVRRNLVCVSSEQNVENNVKRRGRKIDL